jgi:hypothetical protein
MLDLGESDPLSDEEFFSSLPDLLNMKGQLCINK